VAPFFLYLGRFKRFNKELLKFVLATGLLVLFYHGYAYWKSETTGKWNWNF